MKGEVSLALTIPLRAQAVKQKPAKQTNSRWVTHWRAEIPLLEHHHDTPKHQLRCRHQHGVQSMFMVVLMDLLSIIIKIVAVV